MLYISGHDPGPVLRLWSGPAEKPECLHGIQQLCPGVVIMLYVGSRILERKT